MEFDFKIVNYRNKLFWLYDSNMNDIVEITTEELKAIYGFQNSLYTEEELIVLTRLFSLGYLKTAKTLKIEHPLTAYIPSIVDQYTSNMVLQVTQNCNFSCRYCCFANQYGPTRNHKEVHMSSEIAHKAVMFLKEKSVCSKSIKIFFYGGEPLLNYNVIKYCILLAKQVLEDKNIRFEIVTNLSFINNEMIDLFINYNVFLTVSLDGPRDIHDKYRKFAYNGKGSFDNIYNNLRLIHGINEHYFNNNVSINAVIDPAADLEIIKKFFSEDKLLQNKHVTYNHMETEDNNAHFSQSLDHRIQLNSSYINYLLSNLIDANNNTALFSEFNNIDNLSSVLHEGNSDLEDSLWHHYGPCVAGYRKIFVNVYGEFYPCEKVNELNPEMNIGNVDDGYNYEHIEKQLNIAKITSKECRTCWAKKLCFSCQKTVDDSKTLSKKKKLLNCDEQKKNIMYDLKIKCILDKLKEFI